MVNQTQHMRHRILELLYREKGGTVSGVALSASTGISRVAVWKHISALKKEGFTIGSGPKGYHLMDCQDLLLPFCFDDPLADHAEAPLKDRIFYFPQVETTMDTARKLARQGAPRLGCVVAEHQTRGRGRLNREWESEPGGLWFTLILVPDLPPPMAYLYNFAASLSLSKAMETLFNIDVRVKWPNDLLWKDRKLVGLLSEIETQADMIRFLLVGIGINVNNNPASASFNAISLRQILGHRVPRKQILKAFLKEFLFQTRDMEPAKIMHAWKNRTATIGSRVRVETHKQTIQGLAMDVDDTGTLLLKDDHGQVHKIIYGDCFHT
jgi:BirA family transcriptional regulator, biotin operon repressor / biotin---[acetyl-CoA-carboxylase] ligase